MMALTMSLVAALPVPGRSVAASQHGVAPVSHPLPAQAAAQILQRGGSAVDAAIAANAAQGLMEPTSNGIGGDLFAMVYLAKEDKLYGINASGWAPAGMTLELLKSKGIEGELPYRGVYTVSVPGAVEGWAAPHERFGRLPRGCGGAACGCGGKTQSRGRRSGRGDGRRGLARRSATPTWRGRSGGSR